MQRTQAVEVVRAPDLSIVEFHGRVASQTDALSACLATVRAQAAEAPQTPQFDEYTLADLEYCKVNECLTLQHATQRGRIVTA